MTLDSCDTDQNGLNFIAILLTAWYTNRHSKKSPMKIAEWPAGPLSNMDVYCNEISSLRAQVQKIGIKV
jgi:hypothetical protein